MKLLWRRLQGRGLLGRACRCGPYHIPHSRMARYIVMRLLWHRLRCWTCYCFHRPSGPCHNPHSRTSCGPCSWHGGSLRERRQGAVLVEQQAVGASPCTRCRRTAANRRRECTISG